MVHPFWPSVRPKVIFLTGQYGTSHREVCDGLCRVATEKLGHHSRMQPIAKPYSVEEHIWRIAGSSEAFFELPNDSERDEVWRDAFSRVKAEIERDDPIFAFVSLHAVYLWKKRFFSSVDWDGLLTIEPNVIVTLVDDIYDTCCRIRQQQVAHGVVEGGGYTLQEILSWRLREVHTSVLIAKHVRVNPEWFPSLEGYLEHHDRDVRGIDRREMRMVFGRPLDHYVISVKQNISDLYRLLFERKTLRVYSSYPISAPRQKPDADFFESLREWRDTLHQRFVVFDPVAIDEARFVFEKGSTTVRVLGARLAYGIGEPMVSAPTDDTPTWSAADLSAIAEAVIQQVGERDYKLVSQADVVLMWRPLYDRQTHGGVDSEGVFAAAKRIPVHSYHPASDRVGNKPFPPHYGTPHGTEEEVLAVAATLRAEGGAERRSEMY